MKHNKLFSIVTRHEITIFDLDLWNGSTYFQSPIEDGVCCHISFCYDVTFDVRNVVLYQGLNNHTKFGGSLLNSHEITAFYEIQQL